MRQRMLVRVTPSDKSMVIWWEEAWYDQELNNFTVIQIPIASLKWLGMSLYVAINYLSLILAKPSSAWCAWRVNYNTRLCSFSQRRCFTCDSFIIYDWWCQSSIYREIVYQSWLCTNQRYIPENRITYKTPNDACSCPEGLTLDMWIDTFHVWSLYKRILCIGFVWYVTKIDRLLLKVEWKSLRICVFYSRGSMDLCHDLFTMRWMHNTWNWIQHYC